MSNPISFVPQRYNLSFGVLFINNQKFLIMKIMLANDLHFNAEAKIFQFIRILQSRTQNYHT